MRGLLMTSPAILLIALAGESTATQKSANEAPGALRVHPGLVVELVVSEPQVIDPIAIDWGSDGKLWVVEMGDYPLGGDGRGKAGGRIRCLEDTNRDGRYDRSTLFLDGLNYPTGVMAWRKGVLVTCAPEIFFAEDTNGDGRADRREILFTGFSEVNPQHRVNGLRWGLDNWIYCANGDFAEMRDWTAGAVRSPVTGRSAGATQDLQETKSSLIYFKANTILLLSGGQIRSLRTGFKVDIRGKDFRLRVDDGRIDPQVGQSQFGRNRDDWGNWFGCNHAKPLWHFVLADNFIRRNPHVPVPTPRIDVIDSLTKLFVRDGTAHFTSACSAMIYRDELLGTQFSGNAFVCDPARGVVHRSLLSPSGLTFTGRRPPGDEKQQREFLSSEDPAFRPTMTRTGPDGAVWVVDMQRSLIEHAHWLSEGWEKRVDLRAGDDRGRIYRIYPAGTRPRPIRRLVGLKIADLVAALDSPNGWQRDTAQRLLFERQDMTAVPPLEELATKNEHATCRLHALCALDGLGAVRPEIIEHTLSDPHPGVRRHAVRLSSPLLGASAALGAAIEKRAADPDPQVRLQLAYRLGEWKDVSTGWLLGQLVLEDRDSPYLRAAVLSSVSGENLDHVLAAVLRDPDSPPRRSSRTLLVWRLRSRTRKPWPAFWMSSSRSSRAGTGCGNFRRWPRSWKSWSDRTRHSNHARSWTACSSMRAPLPSAKPLPRRIACWRSGSWVIVQETSRSLGDCSYPSHRVHCRSQSLVGWATSMTVVCRMSCSPAGAGTGRCSVRRSSISC